MEQTSNGRPHDESWLPPACNNGMAGRTYIAEKRTFSTWLRTALTMIVTALAVERGIEEQELSKEAFVISLLPLAGAGAAILCALFRVAHPPDRAPVQGVRAPLLLLFLLLPATVLLASMLAVSD